MVSRGFINNALIVKEYYNYILRELISLARVINSRRDKTGHLLRFDRTSTVKEEQLVALLAEADDSEITPVQLTKRLYGNITPANSTAFRQLCSRVQSKLLNNLYFLDYSDVRCVVAQRYEVECREPLHKGTLLLQEGEHSLSEKLLTRALKLARSSEFTDLAAEACRQLSLLYMYQRAETKYHKNLLEKSKLERLATQERQAETIWTGIRVAMGGSVATRRTLLHRMPGYLAELHDLHQRTKTFTTCRYLYQAQLMEAELGGRWQDILAQLLWATQACQQGKINRRRFDQQYIQLMTLYAALRSGKLEQGLQAARQYAPTIHSASYNWAYFNEYYILLALHARQYPLACQLVQQVQTSPGFTKLSSCVRERYEILAAYVGFLTPTPSNEDRRRQLLLIEHAQQVVPENQRDKTGNNVSLLAFQVLYYLRERDIEMLLALTERLRKYQHRYLRGPESVRARHFLRLLQLAPEILVNPAEAERRGNVLLDTLRETLLPAEADPEIIPYEHLWELAIQQIGVAKPKDRPLRRSMRTAKAELTAA